MGLYGSPELLTPQENIIKCKKCKRIIESDLYAYCPYCGTKKGKKGRYNIALIIILILIILFFKISSIEPIVEEKTVVNKEEFISSCQEYSYEEIARNPDSYIDKNIKISGKVLQVQEYNNSIEMRVCVNNNYSDIIYCIYTYDANESKILEDDNIIIWGINKGTKTYRTVFKNSVTIPSIKAVFIELNNS